MQPEPDKPWQQNLRFVKGVTLVTVGTLIPGAILLIVLVLMLYAFS